MVVCLTCVVIWFSAACGNMVVREPLLTVLLPQPLGRSMVCANCQRFMPGDEATFCDWILWIPNSSMPCRGKVPQWLLTPWEGRQCFFVCDACFYAAMDVNDWPAWWWCTLRRNYLVRHAWGIVVKHIRENRGPDRPYLVDLERFHLTKRSRYS